ncbi:hypothetical protein FOCC_FOCC001525, partial [Frankliniella occidentalis]
MHHRAPALPEKRTGFSKLRNNSALCENICWNKWSALSGSFFSSSEAQV